MQNIVKSFLCGFVAALTALFVESSLSILILVLSIGGEIALFASPTHTPLATGIFTFLFAFTEEILKFILTIKVIKKISTSDKNFITNAMIAGIGFLTVEMLFLQGKYTFGQDVAYFELLKLSSFHILTFGVMACLSTSSVKNIRAISQILLPLTIIHFLYNISIFYSEIFQNYVQISILSVLTLILVVGFLKSNKKLAILQ